MSIPERVTRSAGALSLCACIAWSTLPHGSVQTPPSGPGGPSSSSPPSGPGGPPILPPAGPWPGGSTGTGSGQPAVPRDIGKGAVTADGGNRRPTAARGGGAQTGAFTFVADEANAWEFWWEHNQDALLGARPEARSQATTSDSGHLTGVGRASRLGFDVEAAARAEIAPLLQSILRSETEAELCDSATLALARIASPELAPFVVGDIRRGLRHPVLSVQTSAILALGVLGDPACVPELRAIMDDSPAGRLAVGADRVAWQLRAYAALSLGLINDAEAVEPLLATIRDASSSDRELRLSAVTALLLTDNRGWSAARDGLHALLLDESEDMSVRAHASTSLGKLGDASVLPDLLALHDGEDTPPTVQQGVAIALGLLGDMSQPPVTLALTRSIEHESDAPTRQLAFLSLARIAGHARAGEQDDARREIERTLRRGILDPFHRSDRSWAALATGLYLRSQAALLEGLPDALVTRYAKESDPSVRGAFAIAIGLAGLTEHGEVLERDMLESKDESFRGHAAVALGLLGHDGAVQTLLAWCTAPATSDRLRLQATRALGLLSSDLVTVELVAALERTDSINVAWSLSRALGRQRDPRCIDALVRVAEDKDKQIVARAFACVALGLVADKAPIRFNTPIQADMAYLARAAVLEEVIGL
jgi:HEAT repeat protein